MNEKILLQFGACGLGNRLYVMGWCLDKVIHHNMLFYPLWNDTTSWRQDFFETFQLPKQLLFDINNFDPLQLKSQYKQHMQQLPKCIAHFARNTLNKKSVPEVNAVIKQISVECGQYLDNDIIEPGIYITSQYSRPYSDKIFSLLTLHDTVKERVIRTLKTLPNQYYCWHIRATDKSFDDFGTSADEIFNEIEKCSFPKVILTDSIIIKKRALENNIICLSELPDVAFSGRDPVLSEMIPNDNKKRLSGVHFYNDNQLSQSNITKEQLNIGAITDLFIGINATQFNHTTGSRNRSSFATFIERARRANWINILNN